MGLVKFSLKMILKGESWSAVDSFIKRRVIDMPRVGTSATTAHGNEDHLYYAPACRHSLQLTANSWIKRSLLTRLA